MSVISPTYAHAAFIRECLSSVVRQTEPDWELILVDDGSPDNTVEHARSIQDPRIRIIERQHVGLSRLAETYNAALEASHGAYIAVVEGDDRLAPDKLQHQLRLMSDARVVLSHGRLAVIGTSGKILTTPPMPGPIRSGMYDALGPMLLDSFIDPITVLIRRESLERVGGFTQLAGHDHIDYATFLLLAERGLFHATDHVVGYWRRHERSSTIRAAGTKGALEGPRICRDFAMDLRRRSARTDLPDEKTIEGAWSNVLARRLWHYGRVLQRSRAWSDARGYYRSGLQLRGVGPVGRVRLAVGFISTLLRMDIEWLATLSRRGSGLTDL